jgi:hypothetical protein
MAEDVSKKAAAADSPQIAHYKFREKVLLDKQRQLEASKPEQGFDKAAALERIKGQLAEIRAELKGIN